MKRLLEHLLQILLGGVVLLFMLYLPLYKIPYLQGVLLALIIVLCGIWGYLFVKTSTKSSHKKSKKKGLVLMLGIILFTSQLQAGEYCSWAEMYDQQTFQAKMKNWKDNSDRPCDADGAVAECDNGVRCTKRDKARQELNKLRKSPSVFVPSDKLTAAEQKTWRSFRQDSHWKEWVDVNYGDSSGMEPEETACAAMFVSLCSEYERRHPSTRAKTVSDIMHKEANEFGCWPCKMAYITLTVVQKMSSDLEENMRKAGIDILKILMTLWILYFGFFAVIFPTKGATFVKDLLYRVMCVMIAALILSSGDGLRELYKSILSPIVGLGLGMTEGIADALNDKQFSFADEVRSSVGLDSTAGNYCTFSVAESSGTGNTLANRMRQTVAPNMEKEYPSLETSVDALITPELQASLLCMTQKLYRQVSPMTAIGNSLISFSFAGGSTFMGMTLPVLSMFCVGLLLVVCFSIFSFLVAFKIIDIFLRLGFVLVLVPLFVATWAFPTTRKEFTKKGFMFFISIVTEFLGLTLALDFIMLIFETGVMSNSENATDLINAMRAPYSKEYGENLYNVITSHGGWCFLFLMVAVFFVGTKLLSVCTNLISSLFGTQDAAGLGGDITGAATTALIQQTAQKVWKPASEVGKKVKAYEVQDGKSASYLLGRAAGRLKSGQNPLQGESQTASAHKRYFGEKAGNGVNRASQYLAAGIDKIGVSAGQGLSKTGVGAILGVPLTLATKTLSIGVRATGKVASTMMKAPGAAIHTAKNLPKTAKDVKNAIKHTPKVVGKVIKGAAKGAMNAALAGPKNVYNEIKRGVNDGKK